jgi:hypothetical protein
MSLLEAYITPNICKSAYDWAWIWYCDSCQDHGTAETAEEAHYYAQCHAEWKYSVPVDEEGFVDLSLYEKDDSDGENLHYERVSNLSTGDQVTLWFEGEIGDLCDLYITSVKMNKTFSWHYDNDDLFYSDETPHEIRDLGAALEIIEYLGLPTAEEE